MSNSSTWTIYRILSDAITPSQSGPWSECDEVVLCIFQSSSISGASPSDCLMSYTRCCWGSYSSAEMQSALSTIPADSAFQTGDGRINLNTILVHSRNNSSLFSGWIHFVFPYPKICFYDYYYYMCINNSMSTILRRPDLEYVHYILYSGVTTSTHTKRVVLVITLNYHGVVESLKYPFIAITPRSTVNWSVIRIPSMDQIGLFKFICIR